MTGESAKSTTMLTGPGSEEVTDSTVDIAMETFASSNERKEYRVTVGVSGIAWGYADQYWTFKFSPTVARSPVRMQSFQEMLFAELQKAFADVHRLAVEENEQRK